MFEPKLEYGACRNHKEVFWFYALFDIVAEFKGKRLD